MGVGRIFLFLGALNGLAAVALGAFGAHGLKARLGADALAVYHTAVQYHFVHALGLLALGLAALHWSDMALLRWSGWVMLAGIVVFSGSLYALSLGAPRWFGALTPFGGGAFLVAWALLAVAMLRAS